MTDQPIRQYPDERREQAEADMLGVVPAESEPPCCTDPTCACDQVNEAGRCECARWDDVPAEFTDEDARNRASDAYRQAVQRIESAGPKPGHDDGPSVREAAADDRRYWDVEQGGE